MSNELALKRQNELASFQQEVESQRAIQEVQAAFVMAKKFPRSEAQSLVKIIESCKRKRLAEVSSYSYPRGGTTVTGPSIRLAEVLARSWGNLHYGFKVLSSNEKETLVRAYCLDLESNVDKSIEFPVRHVRNTKKGSYAITDERDIYEIVANNASRRVRNCVLAVIPEDIVEEAQAQCEKTLLEANGKAPIGDLIKSMAVKFSEFSVTTEMIEQNLGHKIEVTTHAELVKLGRIYTSIKDNFAPVSSYFVQTKTAKQQEEAEKKIVLFSIQNTEQVKEAIGIMEKMNIAKDTSNEILDKMEGRNIDDLMALVKEAVG